MSSQFDKSPPLVLLGAGGHAKVLLSLVLAGGRSMLGVCDPGLASLGAKHWRGVHVLGGDEALDSLAPENIGLVNGLGQLVGGLARERLFAQLRSRRFSFPALVHPTAWVDSSAGLGEGVQVMAGVVIQADARLGDNTIINTGARIDHDCVLGAHVHVAPGATLCGAVEVGHGAFIGSGATVIQGIKVGEGAVVAAGATLVRDLAAGQRFMGQHRVR